MAIAPLQPDMEQQVLGKIYRHILPFILLCYLVAYIDRTNIGFAALEMNRALGLSPTQYAFGGGIFFIGYMLFEIPSNWLIARVGARLWISRIMISWGIMACGMVFAHSAKGFYILRFLLGLAEAGFFPGVIFYLTLWFPARQRNRVMGYLILGVPLSFIVGSPLSGWLMTLPGWLGLAQWKWLFLLEGFPAILLGVVCLGVLRDSPGDAPWLSPQEKAWLLKTLNNGSGEPSHGSLSDFGKSLLYGRVWAAGMAYMGINFGVYGISLWLPQILKNFGMTNLRVGLLSTLPYAFTAIVMILWTRHADRTGEQRWHAVLPCLLGASGLAASSLAVHPFLAIVAFAAATAGIVTAMPTLWALVTKSLGNRIATAAGAIAMVNSIGQLGGMGGPYLVGSIRQSSGSFALAMVALSLCLIVSAAILFALGAQSSRRNRFSSAELPAESLG